MVVRKYRAESRIPRKTLKYKVFARGRYLPVEWDARRAKTYRRPSWYVPSVMESMDESLRAIYLPAIKKQLETTGKFFSYFGKNSIVEPFIITVKKPFQLWQ